MPGGGQRGLAGFYFGVVGGWVDDGGIHRFQIQPCPLGSLREVLCAALDAAPALSHYVFNDQGGVRKHVAVFVNRALVLDRQQLVLPVQDGDRVLVAQALTGG